MVRPCLKIIANHVRVAGTILEDAETFVIINIHVYQYFSILKLTFTEICVKLFPANTNI